jgi:prepilin-type processing-associated H-X9-DG protein
LGQGWAGQIYPYVKSIGVFDCPDDSTPPWISTINGVVVTDDVVSYAANLSLLRNDNPGSATDPHPGQQIAVERAPSQTVLLNECVHIYGDITSQNEHPYANYFVTSPVDNGRGDIFPFGPEAGAYGTGGQQATGCTGGESYSCEPGHPNGVLNDPEHGTGSNFLMCDGHVKWLNGSQVSGGSVAFASDCNEQGNPALPDCGSNTGMAAGTGNSQFAVTYSPI